MVSTEGKYMEEKKQAENLSAIFRQTHRLYQIQFNGLVWRDLPEDRSFKV